MPYGQYFYAAYYSIEIEALRAIEIKSLCPFSFLFRHFNAFKYTNII